MPEAVAPQQEVVAPTMPASKDLMTTRDASTGKFFFDFSGHSSSSSSVIVVVVWS